ncbi:hypothetical protein OMAG_000453 [Candidatus Omnitrophus magneticus]|uniref:Uncharacterized protein n=1 Tax=Candidatus Omnitrophus magneticus TaxID=1609969 RepID=A0A0F0CVX6_9BACT|nr:hypothetical protein OMAG_000453 [Candidatus Omnitrophus magneticus]
MPRVNHAARGLSVFKTRFLKSKKYMKNAAICVVKRAFFTKS